MHNQKSMSHNCSLPICNLSGFLVHSLFCNPLKSWTDTFGERLCIIHMPPT
ncbi:hypothetical protein Pint_09124 [Pistacia integerrima]|uniref:Uncharacterized protein n=1 Tax=Pistacia integerrima TaxID=434235 RepID=A0ACC0XZG5_9ROSI|nr:hypothetical protein Pint_09124 [Pistacia integerrima]